MCFTLHPYVVNLFDCSVKMWTISLNNSQISTRQMYQCDIAVFYTLSNNIRPTFFDINNLNYEQKTRQV